MRGTDEGSEEVTRVNMIGPHHPSLTSFPPSSLGLCPPVFHSLRSLIPYGPRPSAEDGGRRETSEANKVRRSESRDGRPGLLLSSPCLSVLSLLTSLSTYEKGSARRKETGERGEEGTDEPSEPGSDMRKEPGARFPCRREETRKGP